MGQHVWMILTIGIIALVLLTGGFLVRLRYLAGQVGSFECAMRLPGGQRWLSGVASFRLDSLQWYRLMSLSTRPSRVWRRLDLELSAAKRRREQGRVVEVHCVDATAGSDGFDLAMMEESHSALVAWVESAAPEQPSLY
ncbi:hypothetical protein HMPREF0975_01424 [Actinomyces sp. oral taxon 849 str. F0330]|uniref:DUF2550 family protein n=1 Tax=Actinomyces johnsonii F0542 TaxID=1321818 RepID=U1QU13_9ACTO|nr:MULTISPECIES: DUF2550 family protein [Actinomyces]EHM94519.1 hypothetical protein HMPREF0975_01424 [Actinomyces sp. oral taxon 849 str. F0330]ERH25064.1 hypothetical protein HMPREF1979_00834 [Actinomyces johnsonii F0542]